MKPKKWDKAGNSARMEYLFREAARRGAKVGLATEGALEGLVANDAIRRPELARRVLDVSEPLQGSYIHRFRGLARELRMSLCFGFAERVNDEVFNSAVFIDHEGTICGVHHKMQFAEGYLESWFFNRLGTDVRAFDTPFGRAGIVICNDRWNPTLARALVLDGAAALYIPAYGSRRLRQDGAVLARARENGVPIVEANVGLNLIISKGEIVAKERGFDRITMGEIDIPVKQSAAASRALETEFMAARPAEMKKNYVETMKVYARRKDGKRTGHSFR
jgi:predicted amidohydrolase